MKKIITFLLAGIIIVSLAACGQKEQKKTENILPDKGNIQNTLPGSGKESGKQQTKDKEETPKETEPTESVSSNSIGNTDSESENISSSSDNNIAAEPPKPQPEPETTPEAPQPEPAKPTASQATAYIGASASSMENAIGAPNSKSYAPSCMGENAEDGKWVYDGFVVYTLRENGKETIESVK